MALLRNVSALFGKSYAYTSFHKLFVVIPPHSLFTHPVRTKVTAQQAAQELIFRLNSRERTILLEELQKLEQQANALQDAQKQTPPSSAQLRAVAMHNAVPFLGFGFLDNLIMIVAGDYIDTTIGLTLGISTMAAAGLGNALSDVAGIGSAWYVERIASKIGFQGPTLTVAQINMSRTRWCANLGRAFGVALGCILGMCPLIFLPSKKSLRESKSD